MHEVFSARCQNDSLVMMLSALYGRMRLGRCISGDFNVGCSTDVISFFDAQCTGKRSCDVSVRNLIDIHPCQRDFTSYLDASYRCIQGMIMMLLLDCWMRNIHSIRCPHKAFTVRCLHCKLESIGRQRNRWWRWLTLTYISEKQHCKWLCTFHNVGNLQEKIAYRQFMAFQNSSPIYHSPVHKRAHGPWLDGPMQPEPVPISIQRW